jgi:ribonucleoside-diphosphate reductase alpha chain
MTKGYNYIFNLQVMPSMRAMMTAGEALARDEVAGYNCAYLTFDRVSSFHELMYILTCGAGVGFSVESKYINQLPVVPFLRKTDETIVVADSKYGWQESTKHLVYRLFSGEIPQWDLSRIRKKGTRLRTFGGRASGPEPLDQLFSFIVESFEKRQGQRLRSIDIHDIACMTGNCVVSGGVRRSALISLSDPTDTDMANAKNGNWYDTAPYRAFANNSAVYEDKPPIGDFLNEAATVYNSKCGERGFFNRNACREKAQNILRDPDHEFGTNPCCEIILRPFQFCNLTEVIARENDTVDTLQDKIEAATILGTLQSTLTSFKVLNKNWTKNCEDERLLGVSITGIYDSRLLSNLHKPTELVSTLNYLKEFARKTNEYHAEKLSINPSKAITCVKPSGTVSQLTNTSNGIHPRFARFYVRRVGVASTDPLSKFLMTQGIMPVHQSKDTNLFEFPQEAPQAAKLVGDIGAVQHLKLWKIYNEHFTEHKPSVSIYYDEDEYIDLISEMYKGWDNLSGISIFPKSDHIFAKTAPYFAIDSSTFKEKVDKFPKINWEHFTENEDNTTSSQEFACTAGACEI